MKTENSRPMLIQFKQKIETDIGSNTSEYYNIKTQLKEVNILNKQDNYVFIYMINVSGISISGHSS